ncbi:putative secondary metabolism biosynthetic enzyme [Podospora pseudoanserina]|uniref:Secondary metabolism biosynthetic enzyme n=1 Tax=Podospora pseudoanserina TaxID=2609844 RepID=A0ABR0HVN8_9PEZI|nr:putative secondary metabolism biosynthetic enzyme [Podospora pseudoanserina]
MSSRINTILILGAAGGIGEATARRFHSLGKKVIVTGREQDRERLEQIVNELEGLEYRIWDLTQLDSLQPQVDGILRHFPKLDTVFVNAGIQNHYDIFQNPPPNLAQEAIQELTTNLVAPILVAQAFATHLLSLAKQGIKTNIFLTSSSLAYFPVPFYPTYCPSKAGVASFCKILRWQLEATGVKGMSVVEVAPPYVDTPLNAHHREQTDALQGGPEKAVQPMPLDEYIDKFFDLLENTKQDGSISDEIGVGFGGHGQKVWKQGYESLLRGSGMTD